MQNRPKVAVLLATHNPDFYLEEQVASIAFQIGVDVTIYWGDDHSPSDITERIRNTLGKTNYVEIKIETEGSAGNFLSLLREVKEEEFVAFADQDDIWLPNKLITHIEALRKFSNKPAVTHSNSVILKDGTFKSKKNICSSHTLKSLLVQNCCQGCTMVLNQKARRIVLDKTPSDVAWHDWWVAQLIAVYGKIIFVNGVDTLYRLHENNSIGYPSIFVRIMKIGRYKRGQLAKQGKLLENELLKDNNLNLDDTFKNWNKLCSPNRRTRIVACIVDHRRRKSLVEDFARRVLTIYRVP
jgi:glycosyltransferase involved in cell wall biosynthesis